MQVPNAETWYQTMAALDLWLVGLAALAALIVAVGAVLHRSIIPQKTLNYWLPMPPIWLALAAGLLLRLPRMFAPFWYDETFTATVARLPLDQFWTVLRSDVHPPLYYWLAKVSGLYFGWSEPALRLPSLIGGLALIYAVYRLTLALNYPERLARLAGLLIATFPAFIHYSAEARYPMLLALAVVTGWLAIVRGRSWLFVSAAAAAPLLHATGVIYALLLVLYGFYKRRWLIESGAVLGVIAGSIALIVLQSQDVANGFWLWRMVPLWHLVNGTILSSFSVELLAAYLLLLILAVIAVWQMWRGAGRDLLLVVGVFVPLAMFVVGLVWNPVYLPRALLASVVPIIIGIAAISTSRPGLMGLTIVTVGLSLAAYYPTLSDDNDLAAVFSRCDGYDVTYTTSTHMAVIAEYYAPTDQVWTYQHGNNQHQELSYQARLALGFDFIPPELVQARICAVVSHNYYTTPLEAKKIAQLHKYAELYGRTEIIETGAFNVYEVIYLNRNKPRKDAFTRTISG